ncbi:MAG: oligopeptide/dipeptide ABC transporter ATP-binding protein, partial [Clostridiaceae bacterium]
VGESGCGKSTLGRCLLRLIDITDGEIIFEGENITRKSRGEIKPYRRNMQMIFQNPFSSFNPKMRIGESMREVGHVYKMSREVTKSKILQLLEYISLSEDVLGRNPGELSGGQLQRLAIARALLLNPSFIVADEPVSALDVSVQAQILNLVVDLREQFKMTLMFISHEMTVVEHICDTVAVMYLGKIVELAPTEELFKNLLHPYTQALMSAIPKADPEISTERIMLVGDIPNAIDLPRGCRFASRCRECMEICTKSEPELKDMGNGHLVACHLVSSRGKTINIGIDK